MASILSIETSGKTCSVALHNKGRLMSSHNLHLERSHSSHLITSIQSLIKFSGLTIDQIEAIAVSAGPGSYTGLRIGISAAKGLCYSLGKPLIGVNTLEAMTAAVIKLNTSQGLFCPMIDARRMEVYTLLMDQNQKVVEPSNAKIIDESSYQDVLSKHQITFFGNGSQKCLEVIINPNAHFINDFEMSAEHLGPLAYEKYRNEEFENIAYFEPFYLKDFQTTQPKSS